MKTARSKAKPVPQGGGGGDCQKRRGIAESHEQALGSRLKAMLPISSMLQESDVRFPAPSLASGERKRGFRVFSGTV
jgi:hypothetical protein